MSQRCPEVQHNSKCPNFECRILVDDKGGKAHSVHIDPRTNTRWSHPKRPRGVTRPRH